jgi:hypothetical protein
MEFERAGIRPEQFRTPLAKLRYREPMTGLTMLAQSRRHFGLWRGERDFRLNKFPRRHDAPELVWVGHPRQITAKWDPAFIMEICFGGGRRLGREKKKNDPAQGREPFLW